VPPYREAALVREYYTEPGNSWPAAGTPLDDRPNQSQVVDYPVMDSVFSSDAESPTETTRREALYLHTLGVFSFSTKIAARELNIGDTISVDFPRLGFKQWNSGDPASPDNTATIDSRLAVVVGHYLKPNKAGNSYSHVDLKVFRRIPGYYPTANLN
jgi:hypothetical protein